MDALLAKRLFVKQQWCVCAGALELKEQIADGP